MIREKKKKEERFPLILNFIFMCGEPKSVVPKHQECGNILLTQLAWPLQ